MHSFNEYARGYADLLNAGAAVPLAQAPDLPCLKIAADAPKALIFSPHPDDEVIMGGLPLRLMRQSGWRVINVAVTQGSNPQRQAPRWEELDACCRCIGFELVATVENGLTKIDAAAAESNGPDWKHAVSVIAQLLEEHQPRLIFFPHRHDWNTTHIGVHLLLLHALRQLGEGSCPFICETEFWGQMQSPNLAVESSVEELGDLINALAYHVGEVRRNPYHLSLPAWMIDNTRRGAELVAGQGQAGPPMQFATLYRRGRWDGASIVSDKDGAFLCSADDPASLFTS